LQEVIFDWGDVEERFSERKNAQPEKYLSPIVANDPQRCILCKRCTRVCSEWMGEDAIEAGNRGVNTVIGTYGGWLNCSECGNCIEVCPTGTLLDGVYRHETRPWELEQTITTDTYSSDGMQLSIGTRGSEVHRIVARDRYVNGLNGEFLDIKARFAHGFVNHPDRIKMPMVRYSKGGKLVPSTWDAAIKQAADRFKEFGKTAGVVASPRLTNEAIFTLRRFAADALGTDNIGVSDKHDLAPVFGNLSAPLCTHHDIRHAGTILLIGGEPEEEQTYTAKQIRQAVRNGGAKFICVSDTPTNLARQAATQFVHINSGSYDAFVLGFADSFNDDIVKKLGIEQSELDLLVKTIGETPGDLIVMFGSDLSPDTQGAIAGSVARFGSDTRRVLLHPLPLYNNSVGAHDLTPGRKSVDDVVRNSKALLIGGSLQDASGLKGLDFVVVQEMFLTETTDYADIVFPAASFAEMDGTYTNNAGNVQRVRKAIEPLFQSKPDWMITALIAREMGVEIISDFSASGVFRALADSLPAYAGLRYPALKDESEPVQAKYELAKTPDISTNLNVLRKRLETMSDNGEKNMVTPRIGHKLHRLTTMTGKTQQFHLLAHGNPKPENLLVSPLLQFTSDGQPLEEGLAEAASVGVSDRSAPVK
jgi:predicted molibdopterin-dependent oxidoreductase YjgC